MEMCNIPKEQKSVKLFKNCDFIYDLLAVKSHRVTFHPSIGKPGYMTVYLGPNHSQHQK